jgi:hypothetical protein
MGGATAERGGRRKRFFNLTQKGTRAVTLARISRVNFYQAIGNLDFGKA